MERLNLDRDEKQVLRMVAEGQGVCPPAYPKHLFNASLRKLESKGLVKGASEEGGGVAGSAVTPYGKQYLAENPRLKNPVNFGVIMAIIAAASLIVSIIALVVACSR